VASADSPDGFDAAAPGAVLIDRVDGVLAACWRESAMSAEKGTEEGAVEEDEVEEEERDEETERRRDEVEKGRLRFCGNFFHFVSPSLRLFPPHFLSSHALCKCTVAAESSF